MNHRRKLVAHERNAQDGRFLFFFPVCYCCVVLFCFPAGRCATSIIVLLSLVVQCQDGWMERGRSLLFLTPSSCPRWDTPTSRPSPGERRVSSLRFLHQWRLAETTVCGACVYSGRRRVPELLSAHIVERLMGNLHRGPKPQALSIISGRFSFFKPIQK